MFKKSFFIFVAALPSLAFANFDKCLDDFPNHQVPVAQEQGRDLCFDGFAVYYSPTQKKPIYAAEVLSRAHLAEERQERTNMFYEEARLPAAERATLDDYKTANHDQAILASIGHLDRGHNFPAADARTAQAMEQSFSLANMAPQAAFFNRKTWADVEKETRKYAERASGDVYVFTGITGNIGTIGRSHVVIPQYFFKLVFDQAKNRAWAYWLPNAADVHMSRDAIISYQELVQRTGIDFKIGSPSR